MLVDKVGNPLDPLQVLTVQAGDHLTKSDGKWPGYEFTADIIANLALNSFRDSAAKEAAANWSTQNYSAFLSNMWSYVNSGGASAN